MAVPHRRLVEADNITSAWKYSHILLLGFVAIFGISGGIVLSILYQEDEVFCGTPSFTIAQNQQNGRPNVNFNGSYIALDIITNGKNENACQFTQYTLVCSFIFSTIWITFFMMCGRGGKSLTGLPQPWRIVFPALVFTSIFTCISLGASIQLSVAVTSFCRDFDFDYASIQERTQLPGKCQDLDKFLPVTHKRYIEIQPLMAIGEGLTWLTCIAWGCSAGLCLVRMLSGPDFRPVLTAHQEEGTVSPSSSSFSYTSQNQTYRQTTEAIINPPPFPSQPSTSREVPANVRKHSGELTDLEQRDEAVQTDSRPR